MPRIEALSTHNRGASDAELAAMTAALRARVSAGTPLDAVLPDVFAVVGAACSRVTGDRPTRQQFVAGAALHFGLVAHVPDGEGMEVAVLLAAVLGALDGRGVHVMTAADHVARWHADRARPICRVLGVRVGLLTSAARPEDRKESCLADVTYGMAHQFAYDHLRDNLIWNPDETVQRGQHRALVNDADVVLLDECRTPCSILAPAPGEVSWAEQCGALARLLISDRHYLLAGWGTVSLTDEGVELARTHLGVEDIYGQQAAIINSIRMALRAKDHYRRGREYDVVGGRIVLLDEETGAAVTTRPLNGLVQALEAEEGLPISAPTMLMARITVRRYLRRYQRLSGISASAADIPEGFGQLYGLDVVTVSTHRPSGRVDHDDRLFLTDAQRDDAVLAEVLRCRETGRPVVVGTVTVAAAEHMVRELTDVGVPVRVALGTDHDRDALRVAAAGATGAVTVLASTACRDVETVVDGLTVLGVGRHRSRRHDAPLHGLAGRNGTSGECAFFLSATEMATREGVEVPPDVPPLPDGGLRNPQLTADIAQAQRVADQLMVRDCVASSRFDDVRQDQCDALYEFRGRFLRGGDVDDQFQHVVGDVLDGLLAKHLPAGAEPNDRAIESLLADATAFPLTVTSRGLAGATHRQIRDRLREDVSGAYGARCAEVDRLGAGAAVELQRRVTVTCIDKYWRQHLATQDQLYEDVMARGGPQENQVAEFRTDATAAYAAMWTTIWSESVRFFFHLSLHD